MERKIGIFLFTLLSFLFWLFLAIYLSDADDWWTVMEMEEIDREITIGRVSPFKVLIGSGLFMVLGMLVHKVMKWL
ncbi:hypothetical protein V1502_11045 [Bacillus sp. SCS-153A]|uniref:hypothetical protein n=1 Tax=Rossellomorea sedimentorum TaxID=3115294 RepID=UPI003905DF9A